MVKGEEALVPGVGGRLYPCFLRGLWQASLDGGASGPRIWKDLVTSRGASPLYRSLLCVLRHGTRRIYSSPATADPLRVALLLTLQPIDAWVLDFFSSENSAPGVSARGTRGGRSRS